MTSRPLKIGIDFDGTCVTHDWPEIGKDIGAVPVLKKLVSEGHLLILNTMRGGSDLDAAVNWFKENDIPLYGINEDPGQKDWTQSPKVYANIYIDDAALGCPLSVDGTLSGRPFVDWEKVEAMLSPILSPKIAPEALRQMAGEDEILRMINPAPDPVIDQSSDLVAESYDSSPDGILNCLLCKNHTKDFTDEERDTIKKDIKDISEATKQTYTEKDVIKCLKATEQYKKSVLAFAEGCCKLFEPLTKTLDEWATIHNIKIIDPDGFDRADPDLFKRQFSYSEFQKGIVNCTVEGVNNHGN